MRELQLKCDSTKLLAMPEALKDADAAIKLDPTFVKAVRQPQDLRSFADCAVVHSKGPHSGRDEEPLRGT